MIPTKKATTEIIFSGKLRKNSNGSYIIQLPFEESQNMTGDEYLVTVKGPINSKRTAYNKIVISL